MSIVNQYRREIAIALGESRQTLAALTQMIRDDADKEEILAMVSVFARDVNTVETEVNLISENAEETVNSVVSLRKQRDKAYRDRDNMARLLQRYQEEHCAPTPPKVIDPKAILEKRQTKRKKPPKQQRLFP